MHIAAIREMIQTDLDASDRRITEQLNSGIDLINQLASHLIQSGGKRLRPMLVLLGAHAFGYKGKIHLDLAAIMELIHTATLLHDDVVDTSNMRRGDQTANALWGNGASVLVGDYLYSRAFQMMVGIGDLTVIKALAKATNTIVEGEVLQLTNRNNPDTTQARYMDVIRYKTGTLFETAAQLGAVLCKRPENQIKAMAHYGLWLGIAFQLVDDVLDYSAQPDDLGKNIGDDLAEGKPTLPLIYALAHGSESQVQFIRAAIEQGSRDHLDEILKAIESTGAIAYTVDLARQAAEQAIAYLSDIPDTPYRDALYALARFSVDRNH
ncbi:MAG: polyprenyl synthetase family protein [Gammaproteobacteria bacterium]